MLKLDWKNRNLIMLRRHALIATWVAILSTATSAQPSIGKIGKTDSNGSLDTTTTTTCTTTPCVVSLLGTIAYTTASGSVGNISFAPQEDVYGPFEAGFTSQQDAILQGLGCKNPSNGYVAGGIDTQTAEQIVAHGCGITLPRYEGATYVSLLDECGGHTMEYHFHEKMTCLWAGRYGGSKHSSQIAAVENAPSTQYLYGKYENEESEKLPELDACGGHFGVTPDSNGLIEYHYHVQDYPPFTIGCIGPSHNQTTGAEQLVSIEECRGIYEQCGDGDNLQVTTAAGSKEYDPWCPCYDNTGSNVGSEKEYSNNNNATSTEDDTSTKKSSTIIAASLAGGTALVVLVFIVAVAITFRSKSRVSSVENPVIDVEAVSPNNYT